MSEANQRARIGYLQKLVVDTAAERDAALEQAKRDREYCAAQVGSDVALANQVLNLHAQLATARAEQIRLSLHVSILTNERDEARAKASL